MHKYTDREKQFIDAFQELLNKFKVELQRYDSYNGDDHYQGTDYYFEGDAINLCIGDLY